MRLKLSRLDFNHSPPPTWSRPLHSSLKDTFFAFKLIPIPIGIPVYARDAHFALVLLSVRMSTHTSSLLVCFFARHSRHALFVLSTGCIEDLRFSPEFIRVMTVHLGAQPRLHQVPLFGLVGRCVSSFFTSFHVAWGVRDKSSPFRWDVMRGTQFFFFFFF